LVNTYASLNIPSHGLIHAATDIFTAEKSTMSNIIYLKDNNLSWGHLEVIFEYKLYDELQFWAIISPYIIEDPW